MSEDETKGTPAPPPARQLTLEEEEAAMKSGSWKLPAVLGAFALFVVGGIAFFIISGSEGESIRDTGRTLEKLHRDHYKAFWGCALQQPMERFDSNEALTRRVTKMATGSEKRYAQYVRTKCYPMLGDYPAKVSAMTLPPDMRESVNDLAVKIRAVRSGWDNFLRYLDRAEPNAEVHETEALALAKGWYDYALARNKVMKAQKQILGN